MRFLLDTNVLLHYLRGSDLYKRIEANLNLSSPDNDIMISAVSKGELMALAIRNGWGEQRLRSLNDLLNRLVIIDIEASNHILFEVYSRMDCYSQNALPELKLPQTQTARKMGKNDLWIAATAHLADATLVTTDNDFENLAGVFIRLRYISPTLSD